MPVRGWSSRRRFVVLIALLALFLLVRSLPTLKSDLNSRGRVALSEDRPRYLYHSAYRRNPDRIYEEKLSNALQEIERQQLALNSHEDKAHTLWQIMLGQDPSAEMRSDDSLKFEMKNSEWKYLVRSPKPNLCAWRNPRNPARSSLTTCLQLPARDNRMGRRICVHHSCLHPKARQSVPFIPASRSPGRFTSLSDSVVLWWLLCRHRHFPREIDQAMPIATELSVPDRQPRHFPRCGHRNRRAIRFFPENARLALGSQLRLHPVHDVRTASIQSTFERSDRAGPIAYKAPHRRK